MSLEAEVEIAGSLGVLKALSFLIECNTITREETKIQIDNVVKMIDASLYEEKE